jgi:polar amino acid transport system substrate-binding protein
MSYKRIGVLATVLAVLVIGIAVAGCGSDSGGKAEVQLIRPNTLTIGTSNDAPISFIKGGKAVGVLPDILRDIMKREGFADDLAVVAMPFASLIPSVEGHKIDMVGDGMYVTPDRQKQISFTNRSMFNPEGLVVQKGNPKGLHDLDPAHLSGLTVATYEGTVWVDWLKDLQKKNSTIDVKLYPTIQGVISDIGNGRVDAGVIDASITAYAVKQNTGLGAELVSDYKPRRKGEDAIAFGVAKSNTKLRDAINRGLKAEQSDGTTAKILQRWGLTPTSFYLEP